MAALLPTAELHPTMRAVDGFAVVLGRLSTSIDANWARAGDAADPEGLHDLRVALRRTRAVLRAGRRALPAATVDEATGVLRGLTAATGPARDLDVLVGSWPAIVGDLGPGQRDELAPVLAAVEGVRAAVRAELPTVLDDPLVTGWRLRWPGVIADAPGAADAGRDAGRRLGPVVARRLARLQRDVLAAGRDLGPATTDAEVHGLRKDARRLRHLLECFAELAPGREARVVEHLKSFQAVLGRHQDLAVQLAILERVAAGPRVAGLATRLGAERDATRAEFADRFAGYDTKRVRRTFDHLVDDLRGRSR